MRVKVFFFLAHIFKHLTICRYTLNLINLFWLYTFNNQKPKKFPFFETGNPNLKQHFGFFGDIERKQMKIKKTTLPGHYFALNCNFFAWYINNGQ